VGLDAVRRDPRRRQHRAITRAAQPCGRRGGLGATGLLAFTVVYLGEHYVTDVIVGLALSEAVRRAEPAILPLVHLGLDVLHEIERRMS
jgi:hypothetical protein